MLELKRVGFRIQKRWLVKNIDLDIQPGCFWVIVGSNGSGKSTLMRLLSGELKPSEGQITFHHRSLESYSALHLAIHRAYLTQKHTIAFPFTCFEVVKMGRFAREKIQQVKQDHDDVIFSSMQQAGVEAFSERNYMTLSGGEACRVDFARILAQEPTLFLLDEPTNHLDPRYQIELLSHCRSITKQGHSVVAVLHDLNLASMYADRILLLHDGQEVAQGRPKEVLQKSLLEDIYQTAFEILERTDGHLAVLHPSLP